jgi:Zn-dependent protease with chaperone function
MIDKVRNYILWPFLAIILTMAFYLILVSSLYKISICYPKIEELLWKLWVNEKLIEHFDNKNIIKMERIINSLPSDLLPKDYGYLKIVIMRDKFINAFAAPGGRIIITTGLLDALRSENALMFVLAHEIAHLKCKDHMHELSRQVIAKLYGLITWSELVSEILLLIDSRKMKAVEYFADKWALKIILQHYGHVGGVEEFFYILTDSNKNITHSITATHPTAADRLKLINSIIYEQHLEKKDLIALE